MIDFQFKALPWNIVFGVDSLQRLPEELDKLGKSKALVLTTPNQTQQGEEIITLLEGRAAGLFDQAMMHVPAETLSDATEMAKTLQADCTVALGGVQQPVWARHLQHVKDSTILLSRPATPDLK